MSLAIPASGHLREERVTSSSLFGASSLHESRRRTLRWRKPKVFQMMAGKKVAHFAGWSSCTVCSRSPKKSKNSSIGSSIHRPSPSARPPMRHGECSPKRKNAFMGVSVAQRRSTWFCFRESIRLLSLLSCFGTIRSGRSAAILPAKRTVCVTCMRQFAPNPKDAIVQ